MKTKVCIKPSKKKILAIESRHIFFAKPSVPDDRYFNPPY